jgi:hypothetical protein
VSRPSAFTTSKTKTAEYLRFYSSCKWLIIRGWKFSLLSDINQLWGMTNINLLAQDEQRQRINPIEKLKIKMIY